MKQLGVDVGGTFHRCRFVGQQDWGDSDFESGHHTS